jgi:TonB family protein
MQPALKSAMDEPPSHANREPRFIVEFPPWHKVFFTNVGDLFRPDSPQPWVTSRPAEYWPDALVNRPPAWKGLRLSFLGHVLAALAILWINQLWLNRPQIIPEEISRTTITHYELSQYLPSVARKEKAVPAMRPKAQKADPEYAQQEIVSIHSNPNSLRQTIVHPNPNLLHQDVKLPNLMVSTPIPSAPVASNRPMQRSPMDSQQVAPPPEEIAQRRMSQLTFPAAPTIEVAAPASAATSRRLPVLPTAAPPIIAAPATAIASGRRMPAVPENGPVVIKPSQSVVTRDAPRILLPAQSPEVAAPAPAIAQRSMQAITMAEPQVAPPSQMTSARNLSKIAGAMQSQTVIPSTPPISGGMGGTQSQAMGQILAINIQPLPPTGPVSVPEGNRHGEFAASPEGKPGATGKPEITAGTISANQPDGKRATVEGPGNVYIAEPPRKIMADAVVAIPAPPPIHNLAADVPTGDRVATQIFGSRKQYSIRLSMPNLNSITGSWIMRFARLNSEPGREEDISAPEPLSKVDPAYPMSMMQDRVQGTVTLYAIIRSNGTVGDVRVLDGFDARLDENARVALERWRFRPGTRNGAPVDVEAVVRVPFKLAKPAF